LISNHRGENRKTLALAFPIVAGFLGQMLMGLVDTVMVGWVGVLPLAACAFANTILSVPLVFGFGLLSSVSVRASHAFGSGNPELAGESLRGGILLSLLMGGALAVTAHVTLPFLMSSANLRRSTTPSVAIFFSAHGRSFRFSSREQPRMSANP